MATPAENIANTRKLLNEAIEDLYIAYVLRSDDGDPKPNVYAGPLEQLKAYYDDFDLENPGKDIPEDYLKAKLASDFDKDLLFVSLGKTQMPSVKVWALWVSRGNSRFTCTLYSRKPNQEEYQEYNNGELADDVGFWLLPANLLKKKISISSDD